MALKCEGYGSSHGFAKGRLWFACGACRWRVSAPVRPKAMTLEEAEAFIAALPRDLVGEALEAQGLDPHG